MPIIQSFTPQELRNLAPGELFAVERGGRALCIAIGDHEEGMARLVVVLSPEPDRPHPRWTRLSNDADCIAYGRDWVIDLDDARESCPGAGILMDQPGSITVSSAGTMLRAGSDGFDVRSRAAYFDLRALALSPRNPDAASAICVRQWSLWLNAAERLRLGARPLFEFAG